MRGVPLGSMLDRRHIFDYHVQGREDLAYHFSEEFVGQFDDLAWGEYAGDD
jgi:hypothetical protein